MIRTTITPKNNDLHLSLPDNYIGKEIEVILFSKDEMQNDIRKKDTLVDLKGLFSKEEATAFINQIDKNREEWDNTI